MAIGDLASLAEVKAFIPVNQSDDDDLLAALISQASAIITDQVDLVVVSGVQTDDLDGNGRDRIMLTKSPVAAVTSVTIDDAVIPAAVGGQDSGWFLSSRTVFLRNYQFTKGRGNVTIAYNVAPTAQIAAELKRCCIKHVADKYRERDRLGEKSKVISQQTVAFDVTDFSEEVKAVMDHVRNVVPL
jgi:hypothetical protein